MGDIERIIAENQELDDEELKQATGGEGEDLIEKIGAYLERTIRWCATNNASYYCIFSDN